MTPAPAGSPRFFRLSVFLSLFSFRPFTVRAVPSLLGAAALSERRPPARAPLLASRHAHRSSLTQLALTPTTMPVVLHLLRFTAEELHGKWHKQAIFFSSNEVNWFINLLSNVGS